MIFPIELSNDLVITILNSRTLDDYYWIFVPQLHATGDIINLNGAVYMVLHQLHVMKRYPSNCLLFPIIRIVVVSPAGMKIYLTQNTFYTLI